LPRVRELIGALIRPGNVSSQPEVDHFHAAAVGQHDVLWFEITMEKAMIVNRFEGARYLNRDFDGTRELDGASPEPASNRLAADVLHCKPENPVVVANIVDSRNARVIDRRPGSGFEKEAVAYPAERWDPREHFDCNVAPQRLISGLIDDAHPTPADYRLKLVTAEASPSEITDFELELR
jgi:hypothetical protein